jgi:urease accessory protein UreH
LHNQSTNHPIARSPDHAITRSPDLRAVGRAGALDLVFERRGERTVLARQQAVAPLRVGAPFSIGDAAHLICVCTGPGVFAGDTLHQRIHVKRGARVVLTSQSALQVHPSNARAPARIEHAYRIDEDAELHCHWDPVIPFAGARIEQRFHIDVAPGGRLCWSDALMSGRASSGEAWRFDRLAHELRLRVGGALAYLERFTLHAARCTGFGIQHAHDAPPGPLHVRTLLPSHAWLASDRHYFSTTLVRHSDIGASDAEAVHAALGVQAGVDLVADGLLLVRISSASGAAFAAARQALRRSVAASIFEGPSLVDRR